MKNDLDTLEELDINFLIQISFSIVIFWGAIYRAGIVYF